MKPDIRLGQVWKAIKDYTITEPYSEHRGCIIPKDTRVVILHTLRRGAQGFYIMPLTSKNLDKKLVPDLKQMALNKEGFGVLVLNKNFFKYFILDKNQTLDFDNADAGQLWKRIIEHTDPKVENIIANLDSKSLDKFITDNP
jgi:hypothetical protein